MKIQFKVLAFVSVLIAGLVSHAQSSSQTSSQTSQDACLDEALVQEIRSHIDLQVSDVAQFDRCQPTTHTYLVLQALSLIKTMRYTDDSLAAPFSQDILPGDFWTYFSTRVNKVQEEDSCPPNVLAFVYGILHDGVVHVCPQMMDASFLKYERAETMLHEARHFEGYSHVTCIRGNRKGQSGACDDTVEEKGSYAVTVEVLTKMALNAKDIPKVQQTLLKTLAVSYANDVFNTPVYDHDLTAFYLEGVDQQAYIYSNKGLVQVASLGADVHLISRSATLAVFPAGHADTYTVNVFSPILDAAPAQGSFSLEYNSTPPDQRDDVVDIMNLGYLSASVTAHQIKGQLTEDIMDTVINLPWVAKAAFSGSEVGLPDENSLYILNDQSALFRVQFKSGQTYQLDPVANALGSFKQVSIYNGHRLALDTFGVILLEDGGTFQPFAPLAGKKFSQMTRPFVWDQYFEDPGSSLNLN